MEFSELLLADTSFDDLFNNMFHNSNHFFSPSNPTIKIDNIELLDEETTIMSTMEMPDPIPFESNQYHHDSEHSMSSLNGMFVNENGKYIKGKKCQHLNCFKRAQSAGLCKKHGGGARCQQANCTKSAQGGIKNGQFCRVHGGGITCLHEGCTKGQQRNGLCYSHGGNRLCTVEGCDKIERSSGKCTEHGGGKRCSIPNCSRLIRKNQLCYIHLKD